MTWKQLRMHLLAVRQRGSRTGNLEELGEELDNA